MERLPGGADLPVIQAKPQWIHQMQTCARIDAEGDDIAGVQQKVQLST